MSNHLPEKSDSLPELREKLRNGSRDSFKLLENFWENPICSVNLNESSQLITVVWKQYATQAQLRFIHENLLGLIRSRAVSKILGDDTALPAIASEDRFWIIENWMPRAVESGLRFAASKRPESYFGRLSTSHIQSAAPAGLQCRSFELLDEAKKWIETVTAD